MCGGASGFVEILAQRMGLPELLSSILYVGYEPVPVPLRAKSVKNAIALSETYIRNAKRQLSETDNRVES